MSLSLLKYRLKIVSLLLVILFYGLATFSLGSSGLIKKILDGFHQPPVSLKNRLAFPQEVAIPAFDIQQGEVFAGSVKLCSNTFYGFEISYPSNYFTTHDTALNKCNYFAQYSFVIPTETDDYFVPVKVEPIRVIDWPQTLKYFENPNEFQNIVSVQTITINEKSVLKVEAKTSGADGRGKGLVKISFLVYNSRVPLVFSYQQPEDSEDTKLATKTLEEMVASLNHF